jgi:glycogen synthase
MSNCRVLMFGWEFPPFASGGLGTACYGLTKGLKNHNVDVTFVMPKKVPKEHKAEHVDLMSAHDKIDKVLLNEYLENKDISVNEILTIDSPITPYMSSEQYDKVISDILKNEKNSIKRSEMMKILSLEHSGEAESVYGKNLNHEVWRYRLRAGLIAQNKNFDVIHAHDWLTFGAGIEAKKVSGRPLVVHIHATEFDRTGGNPNPYVYNLEKEGFEHADKICAVSNYTKNKVVEHYGIDPAKIEVVHNAVEHRNVEHIEAPKLSIQDKIVLFLGRITIQKGPDWFLKTAKLVLDHNPKVTFVVAGSGDMESHMISQAAELGISDKIHFTGFLSGDDIDRAYKMASLYVMPSISEPFGITPLESMRNGTPVLISKQSGVSEVVTHCLKADFWDTHQMANQILGVVEHSELHEEMRNNGYREIKKFHWDSPAKKCVDIYHSLIRDYSQKKESFNNIDNIRSPDIFSNGNLEPKF